jgi:hypothetical protein
LGCTVAVVQDQGASTNTIDPITFHIALAYLGLGDVAD